MFRIRFILLLVIVLTGGVALSHCSSPAGAKLSRSISFSIVSGNHQTAHAGDDSLLEPVVGQAYRQKNGSVALRLFGPQPLNAQTTFGTGVPNILTCASAVGPAGLTPWMQCAQTDAQGLVQYWFEPDTIATDSACAEIRATPDGQPAVLATTCSTVKPGPWVTFGVARFGTNPPPSTFYVGDTVNSDQYVTDGADLYRNKVSRDTIIAQATSVIVSLSNHVSPCNNDSVLTISGWQFSMPDFQKIATTAGWAFELDSLIPDSLFLNGDTTGTVPWVTRRYWPVGMQVQINGVTSGAHDFGNAGIALFVYTKLPPGSWDGVRAHWYCGTTRMN